MKKALLPLGLITSAMSVELQTTTDAELQPQRQFMGYDRVTSGT